VNDNSPVVVVDEEEAVRRGLSAIGCVPSGKCFLGKRREQPLQGRDADSTPLPAVSGERLRSPGLSNRSGGQNVI
jgi:hypothetical protein